MIKKIFYFFLTTLITTPLFLSSFNFSDELTNTYPLTNPFDLIAAYQAIAKQITTNDSSRLSKKFIRKITTLHQLCHDSKNSKIKLAFKILLATALSNPKLKSLDHANILTTIFSKYETIEPSTPTPEPTDGNEQTPTPTPEPTVPSPGQDEANAKRELLKTKTKYGNRDTVINLLMLKKIANQIERVKDEMNEMKKEISDISQQDAMIKENFRKLIKLERLLQQNPLTGQMLTRSPIEIEEELPEELASELEELSPLVREVLLGE